MLRRLQFSRRRVTLRNACEMCTNDGLGIIAILTELDVIRGNVLTPSRRFESLLGGPNRMLRYANMLAYHKTFIS
jgi:hypothetical protein